MPAASLWAIPNFCAWRKPDALLAACQQVKAAVTFDNPGRSVTLKLPRPYAPLFAALAGPWASIVQKNWMAEQGEWDGDCRTWQYFYGTPPEQGLIRDKANGTGPYQLDHWTPGAEIVLTGNPNYRQGAPKIDRVEIKSIGNFEQRLQSLLARDADLIETTSAEEQARLDKLVREKCDASGQCDVINFTGYTARVCRPAVDCAAQRLLQFRAAERESVCGQRADSTGRVCR